LNQSLNEDVFSCGARTKHVKFVVNSNQHGELAAIHERLQTRGAAAASF
jgi:hypothetical protein